MGRLTVKDIQAMKERGERIAMVTAYEYTMARAADAAGVHMVLVGDTLGMVVLGYDSTIPVTMEDMLHHVRPVVRGTQRALVVGDLPFMSYHISPEQALQNAARMMQEGGCQAVKLEGGATVAETVRRIVACGIPVMGHIGLTPQSVHALGGFRVQGRGLEEARRLLADAVALEEAGCFAVVLELVPAPLARLVSRRLRVPTIGIGAGPHCDGQVQVLHDLLGLYTDFVPKHAKRYLELAEEVRGALARYVEEVQQGAFPTEKESFKMDEAVLAELAGDGVSPRSS